MSETAPIACTLSPADMPQRAADIRALGRDALLAVEGSEARATLRFRRDPATRARVETIIAAESKCCAFIDFELADAGDAIVLTLEAPAGGEAAMHMLADLFAVNRRTSAM
jgi:hypothetical protein